MAEDDADRRAAEVMRHPDTVEAMIRTGERKKQWVARLIAHAIRKAVEAERERCARHCDSERLKPHLDDVGEVLQVVRRRIEEGKE